LNLQGTIAWTAGDQSTIIVVLFWGTLVGSFTGKEKYIFLSAEDSIWGVGLCIKKTRGSSDTTFAGGFVCDRFGGAKPLLICGGVHVVATALLPVLTFHTPYYIVATSRFILGIAQVQVTLMQIYANYR
jgi:hypothetical protein